ncbi:MAG: tRNA 2-selenouridine(34) synthase MnmH [Verrucomicrobia bacterium]|nr:tRNA 2-selenouridine(34) synthase MnmH [Verrucomicrobiota bacterium]MBS0636684.1 tRNA 2-selenouridine(34) synthase MnmH [Verrucomicrobiota bacterium]
MIFDVRSPKEYTHAHIPGAISLPLFSDEERALIGTTYKREGQLVAVRLGIKILGPKLADYLAGAEAHLNGEKRATVYCWRGGMRSGFVCQFLGYVGIVCDQMKGGYKAYRREVLKQLQGPYTLKLIGGYTGAGKTDYLHTQQAQTIDLEALAHHRGSVYGELGKQPSNEQFENDIAHALSQANRDLPIWVEDESRLIGHCQIPTPFYEAMRQAPLYFLHVPKEERIKRIRDTYSKIPTLELISATQKLARRLNIKPIVAHIEQGALDEAIDLLLTYYDKAYDFALSKHQGPIYNEFTPD